MTQQKTVFNQLVALTMMIQYTVFNPSRELPSMNDHVQNFSSETIDSYISNPPTVYIGTRSFGKVM